MHNKILLVLFFLGLCVSSSHAQQNISESVEEKIEQEKDATETILDDTILTDIIDSDIMDIIPLEEVASKKALPSEQVLGKINSDVFKQMADLERENVFLKLQSEQETLKNNLENLKANNRQKKLEEIEKRENIIRTRVEWMQAQEQAKQDLLKQKAQIELLQKQKEEAELKRQVLLAEQAIYERQQAEYEEQERKRKEKESLELLAMGQDPEEVLTSDESAPTFPTLTVLNVRGVRGRVEASVYGTDGKIIKLGVGSTISGGYKVTQISPDEVVFTYKDIVKVLPVKEEVFVPKDEPRLEEEFDEEETENMIAKRRR